MKVKLLKDLGDHSKGDDLEIKDQTVIDKWIEIGVIEKPKKESK